jgi:hypothetical protein
MAKEYGGLKEDTTGFGSSTRKKILMNHVNNTVERMYVRQYRRKVQGASTSSTELSRKTDPKKELSGKTIASEKSGKVRDRRYCLKRSKKHKETLRTRDTMRNK